MLEMTHCLIWKDVKLAASVVLQAFSCLISFSFDRDFYSDPRCRASIRLDLWFPMTCRLTNSDPLSSSDAFGPILSTLPF
jgi:hypothetical protein